MGRQTGPGLRTQLEWPDAGLPVSGLQLIPVEGARSRVDMSNPNTLKSIMKAHGIRAQHRLGQNFLVNSKVLDAIVASTEAGPADLVLEIGPGLGSLTQQLTRVAGHVVAVELDRNLIAILAKTAGADAANLEIIHGDAARIDLKDLLDKRLSPGQRAIVAANLPYYITTPLIMRFLEEELPVKRMIFMVQKEVAERIVSPPGSKEYGALSVAVQYYTEPKIVLEVGSEAFIPPPDVSSAVIALQVRSTPAVVAPQPEFFRVVKAAFGQRRKNLLNALSAGLQIDRAEVHALLERAGIDQMRRGETLSLEEFASIARILAP